MNGTQSTTAGARIRDRAKYYRDLRRGIGRALLFLAILVAINYLSSRDRQASYDEGHRAGKETGQALGQY